MVGDRAEVPMQGDTEAEVALPAPAPPLLGHIMEGSLSGRVM
jgi:hypothetical protein